ncbi:sarcosine oxidase subunit gamma [Marinovum sp.]|uniref:sarcosine oxidase subunit gamma n=1 Tax=Marinovum sp. TaxID=2024839 RepID=UPI002B275896|nr:sarcosine oxidase subunit gamma family protein [Marinovum sp.]
MSEALTQPVTALGGARFDGLISVREMPAQGMISLRGDLALPPVKNAATGVAGFDMPARRAAQCAGQRGLLWMAPDEVLVLCPYDEVPAAVASMEKLLFKFHSLVTDVSDARAMFELRGGGLRDVLAKLTPADMSATALPPGELRRSRLAQVPAAFWLESEARAQVICYRSVARYVFDLLKSAARPGSAVGFH